MREKVDFSRIFRDKKVCFYMSFKKIKIKKRFAAAFLAVAALVGIISISACSGYGSPKISVSFDEIIHAGGELWGIDSQGTYRSFLGSNSLEGLEQCAAAGKKAVELDFNFTSDGELVCIHDWSAEYIAMLESNSPISYDEFKESEIFFNYTPIGIDDVTAFLAEHPNMYIVTDIKERFDEAIIALAEAVGDMKNRVIVQIYSEDQYDIARDAGFDGIIFTLYKLGWEEKTDYAALVEFERSHPLVGFAFSTELCSVEDFVDGMKKSGVPLYVHTVNDPAEITRYKSIGIQGVYTDTVK